MTSTAEKQAVLALAADDRPAPPRRRRSTGRSINVFYLPALILIVTFIGYPFIRGIAYSVTDWDGFSQTFSFVGLDQYARMLTDQRVVTVLLNTLIYAIGSTILQNVLGLGYALLLDQKLRGSKLVRTIVYLPIIVSNLIMGYIWYFMVRFNGGALNEFLGAIGQGPVNPLADRNLAVLVIVLANTFQYVGVAMILYLSGLQAIPRSLMEAAEIDGASPWRRFWNVTLPLLAPSVTISAVVNVIGGLNIFAVIVALTNGGPGYASASLGTITYQLYFGEQNAGYAAALGILTFTLAAVLGLTTLYFLRRREVELS